MSKIRHALLLSLLLFLSVSVMGLALDPIVISPASPYPLEEITVTATVTAPSNWKLACGSTSHSYNLCVSENFVNPSYANTCVFTNPFSAGDTNSIYCQAFLDNNVIYVENYSFENVFNATTDWNFHDANHVLSQARSTESPSDGTYSYKYSLETYDGQSWLGLRNAGLQVSVGDIVSIDYNCITQFSVSGLAPVCATGYSSWGTPVFDSNDCAGDDLVNYCLINPTGTQDVNVRDSGYLTIGSFGSCGGGGCPATSDLVMILDNVRVYADSNSLEDTNTITTQTAVSDCITTCTPIDNVASCTVGNSEVVIVPIDEDEEIEWSMKNTCTSAQVVPISVHNSQNDRKQYFIHTSTDGINYDFDDTLTFGSTPSTPIQKLWDNDNSYYTHEASDTILTNHTAYHKWKYKLPIYSWSSLEDNVDWDMQLEPTFLDLNGKFRDLYSLSSFANMSSTMIYEVADINTDDNPNYAWQFNAYYTDATAQNLLAGTITEAGAKTTETLSLTETETRYSVDVNGDFIYKETSNTQSATVYMNDYSVVQRGHFTAPLEIRTVNNQKLPVRVGDSNNFYEYIVEGVPFKVLTSVGNWQGDLDYYEIEAYITEVTDVNRVAYKKVEVDEDIETFTINDTVEGLLDLTENADDRDVRIVVRLINLDGDYYEIQSDFVKMLQYPTYPSDVRFSFTQTQYKVGESPQGAVSLLMSNPELLRGIKFEFFGSTIDVNADFNITLYKGVDFNCVGISCSFNYKFTEYVFPKQDTFNMRGTLLVETEAFNTDNPLLSKTLTFLVFHRQIVTARILQTRERTDWTYRNDEPIELILQMRDGAGSNLANALKVYLTLWECETEAGADCIVHHTTRYYPNSEFYDIYTGYNYYIYRQVFLEDDLTLLSDGNYFQFKGVVEDVENGAGLVLNPVLTGRCYDTNYTDVNNFWGQLPLISTAFGWYNDLINTFSAGCVTPQFDIVTTTVNSGQEKRILIDADHNILAPEQTMFACINADNNFTFVNNLEQELLCATWYKLGEAPIDSLEVTITNENSDTSESVDEYKQYVNLKMPYEYITFNDIALMHVALQENQNTSIDTVGELIYFGLGQIYTGISSRFVGLDQFLSGDGVIANAGFDINEFSNPLDARYISGVAFYKIKGLKVINAYDYRGYAGLSQVDMKRFKRQADALNVTLPNQTTDISVYTSGMDKVYQTQAVGSLIINEEPLQTTYSVQNLDDNTPATLTAPNRMKFTLINQMNYNWGRSYNRLFVIIWLDAILQAQGNIVSMAVSWFFTNIGWIFIILLFAIIVSYIYANFKGGGQNITINTRSGNAS